MCCVANNTGLESHKKAAEEKSLTSPAQNEELLQFWLAGKIFSETSVEAKSLEKR